MVHFFSHREFVCCSIKYHFLLDFFRIRFLYMKFGFCSVLNGGLPELLNLCFFVCLFLYIRLKTRSALREKNAWKTKCKYQIIVVVWWRKKNFFHWLINNAVFNQCPCPETQKTDRNLTCVSVEIMSECKRW